MNRKLKLISCVIVVFATLTWCGTVFADEITGTLTTGTNGSESTGTLTTGLNGSAGTGVSGIVMAAPVASSAAGTYASAQSVTLSASGASSINYTTDGTVPTCSTGTVYAGAISVGSSETIQAVSCYPNNIDRKSVV